MIRLVSLFLLLFFSLSSSANVCTVLQGPCHPPDNRRIEKFSGNSTNHIPISDMGARPLPLTVAAGRFDPGKISQNITANLKGVVGRGNVRLVE
jgi:hypothetical protein